MKANAGSLVYVVDRAKQQRAKIEFEENAAKQRASEAKQQQDIARSKQAAAQAIAQQQQQQQPTATGPNGKKLVWRNNAWQPL